MAKIVHPCYHQDQFRFDTDTSQIELLLSPSGYLSADASGLKVDMPAIAPMQPANHVWHRHQDFILTGPINTGILDIGGNGAVSTVQTGTPITNPFTRPLILEARVSFNGMMLAATTLCAAALAVDMTWDGSTWERVCQLNLFSPDGSNARTAYSNQQDVSRAILAPAATLTPQFVVVYAAVYDHVDYVQASFIKTDIFGHTA